MADSASDASEEEAATADAQQQQQQSIRIFARIRPRRFPSKRDRLFIDSPAPGDDNAPQLHFTMPKDELQGLINNQRERYDFRFDRCFDPSTNQEEIFDYVAKEVAQSVLDGYNGTIFAYGQTGSGKTFTITGGAERYADRGLIPRSIQFIFAESAKRSEYTFTVHISYLEIYNESGYDLLDNTREAKKLEDLPKVTIRENEESEVHLQNLSSVPAPSEEEALNLLFLGDTNKMIAETPSNPASSRSHCLFIITVTSRKEGGDLIRTGKLHLVDLAGSERVSKTGIDGTLLREAKHINLSLHYLEQVIIALHEKSLGKRSHIPYRNSMMTTILRDSLGGNCKTTMIATLATEDSLIDESISTCRFAQRVALIKNVFSVNEQADPYLVIAKLNRQIAQLKAELALARGESEENMSETLPEYELDRCRQTVDDFLADTDRHATLTFTDYRKVAACFNILKNYVLTARRQSLSQSQGTAKTVNTNQTLQVNKQETVDLSPEISRLKQLVAHRDNEISVLVSMMNELKAKGETRVLPHSELSSTVKTKPTRLASDRQNPITTSYTTDTSKSSFSESSYSDSGVSSASSKWTSSSMPEISTRLQSHETSKQFQQQVRPTVNNNKPEAVTVSSPTLSSIPSDDRTAAFEQFKAEYPQMRSIEEQKTLLKVKYSEAKSLGESANRLRTTIKQMKDDMASQRDEFDRRRLENPTLSLSFAEEETARRMLATTITEYKVQYEGLKELKKEIEHLQHLLENARVKLQKDFQNWLANNTSQTNPVVKSQTQPQRAWATPPPPLSPPSSTLASGSSTQFLLPSSTRLALPISTPNVFSNNPLLVRSSTPIHSSTTVVTSPGVTSIASYRNTLSRPSSAKTVIPSASRPGSRIDNLTKLGTPNSSNRTSEVNLSNATAAESTSRTQNVKTSNVNIQEEVAAFYRARENIRMNSQT